MIGLVCMALLTSDLQARDWYVSPVDTIRGSISGNGSRHAPWNGFSSIQWGAAGVQPGDSLLLQADAIFHETLLVGMSGQPDKLMSIRCTQHLRCRITGDGQQRRTGIRGVDISHVEISGIEIDNHKNSGIRLDGSSVNVTVRDVWSHDNGAFGIAFMANGGRVSNISISNNRVSANGRYLKKIKRYEGAGIFLTAGTNGIIESVSILKNVAHDNRGVSGIMVYTSFHGHHGGVAHNVSVVDNTAYDNGGSGIDFTKRVLDSEILNNDVWGNGALMAGSGIHMGGVKDEFAERILIAHNRTASQHFVDTDGAGILVDDFSVKVVVRDNESTGNEGAGIKLHNCSDVEVRNNRLDSNGSGVLAPGASNYRIIDNRIIGNRHYGVRIYSSAQKALVTGNYIDESSVAIRDDSVALSNGINGNCLGFRNVHQGAGLRAGRVRENSKFLEKGEQADTGPRGAVSNKGVCSDSPRL